MISFTVLLLPMGLYTKANLDFEKVAPHHMPLIIQSTKSNVLGVLIDSRKAFDTMVIGS